MPKRYWNSNAAPGWVAVVILTCLLGLGLWQTQDDEDVQAAIQAARDMIADLEWVEPEGDGEV